MTQYGFYIDVSACSGCKTCQIACKDKNNLDLGVLWRRVYEISGGDWLKRTSGAWEPRLANYYLSISCNHCEAPACLPACPTEAIFKNEDGLVLINDNKCIGCKYCEWACPYGAPQFDIASGLMTKCDLCYDYLKDSKLPSCVSSCPMRALDFGQMDVLQEKYGSNRSVYPLPRTDELKPSLVITPHAEAKLAEELSAKIVNKEETENVS